MLKLPEGLRRFFRDRRSHSEKCVVEQRQKKPSRDEADKRLIDAVDDLEMTVRMRREDLLK